MHHKNLLCYCIVQNIKLSVKQSPGKDFSQHFPDDRFSNIFLTSVKVPDNSKFSTQLVTLILETRTHQAVANTAQSSHDQTVMSLASWTASATAPVLQHISIMNTVTSNQTLTVNISQWLIDRSVTSNLTKLQSALHSTTRLPL